MKKLYNIYEKDYVKYDKPQSTLVEKLRQTDRGTKFYIKQAPFFIEDYIKLAKHGDIKSIISLARFEILKPKSEYTKISKQWQKYILSSRNYELRKAYKTELSSYKYKYINKAKDILKTIKKQDLSDKNILVIRDMIKEASYKNKLKYIELAYSYGDIKNGLELAYNLTFKGFDWKYTQDKNKKKEIKAQSLKGIKIYKELAKKNSIKALRKLGDIFSKTNYQGDLIDGSLVNNKEALKYYTQGKLLGDTYCLIRVASLYNCEHCNTYDVTKAIENLKIIINAGIKKDYAQTLGLIYLKKGKYFDPLKAKKYFEISKSYYYLTKLYSNKDMIEVNYNKALSYLKKCSDLTDSNLRCHYLMGIFYKNGNGVKKDIQKAVLYLNSASYDKYYNLPAAKVLGDIYAKRKMYKEAVEVYLRGAKNYKKDCVIALGKLYKKGKIKKKKLQELINEYKYSYKIKYIKFDEINSAKLLGLIYEKAIGVKKNTKEAIKWYKNANSLEDVKRLEKN